MPKLSYYQKKVEPLPLERVQNDKARKKVLDTVRAIEMHLALSCIAIGLLQSLSTLYSGRLHSNQIRYQRTPSHARVSEAALMDYFRRHFFRLLAQQPDLSITRIILGRQYDPDVHYDFLAS